MYFTLPYIPLVYVAAGVETRARHLLSSTIVEYSSPSYRLTKDSN